MKKEIIDFLKKAQEIIVSDGETDFSEIRKKKRLEITHLFTETFNYETDGDTDGCSMFTKGEINGLEYNIGFWSDCEYTDDIPSTANDMVVSVHGKNIDKKGITPVLNVLESLKEQNLSLALLNTSILTATGSYILADIKLEEAKELINHNTDNLDSAIGHQSTAEIMTTLLGVDVPVNRQLFSQEVGQQALVFKLNGRPQEGKILTATEIEEMGYKFQLLTRTK